jgi:Tol biopolymer transport system component
MMGPSHAGPWLAAAVITVTVAAQGPAPRPSATAAAPAAAARWDRAVEAWDAGQYPEALTDLIAVAGSPAAAEYHERMALLTGELFRTIELTPDGRNPRVSSNGQYVAYDTGTGADAVTRIVRLAARDLPVADLRTGSVAFDPAGTRVAWLRPAQTAEASSSAIVVRDLSSGQEREWLGGSLLKSSLAWSGDGRHVLFLGIDPADRSRSDVYGVDGSGEAAVRLSTQPGLKSRPLIDPQGDALVYLVASSAGRAAPRAGGGGPGGANMMAVIEHLRTGTSRTLDAIVGTTLTMSADGRTLAWMARNPDGTSVLRRTPTDGGPVMDVRATTGAQRLDAPALSPDGALVAYQFMANVGSSTDWDIHVTDRAGTHRRVTADIQHDVLPRFLTADRILGLIGEPRHRRAYVYDLATGSRHRVFANNTLRTISPEYGWIPSADGRYLAIEADRDGDTVSASHSVSVVDLGLTITPADLGARLDRQLTLEADLRRRMAEAFTPLADLARTVVARMSPTRVYRHEYALSRLGSKHISQPGNARAVDYLHQAYASFGYTPEHQWFTVGARGQRPGGGTRTANVVATLKGTENPDLIYVVSSHFDSVPAGPGADDNTSGTAALLEAARALADTPLPATIVFASLTGEEAGLLGSREFVRLAAERTWRIAGALNNDMIGWAGESGRMDNTIRYSNPGIRDIQHGAAFLFTDLILYDAKYYRGTDAAAFYESWGDIVGGIGSYPVLGNPNYHQATDLLETINFRQVAETAKVTAATLIYLASSPSRLTDLRATRTGRGIELTWTPSPEAGVTTYIVAYGPDTSPFQRRLTVKTSGATLPAVAVGTQIAVKAVNRRGLEGWDWARTVAP